MIRIMLLGNPNCGKTTLFNACTGQNQKVGNWPGVTVEQKIGSFTYNNEQCELIDLPGLYSLTASGIDSSLDAQITANAVLENDIDLFINIIDASQLERNLYLTSQLLELGKPVIVAINMTDLAHKNGIEINHQALGKALNCPVVLLQANKEIGIENLKKVIFENHLQPKALQLSLQSAITKNLHAIESQFPNTLNHTQIKYCATRLIEGDTLLIHTFLKDADINYRLDHEEDIAIVNARYKAIHKLVTKVENRIKHGNRFSNKLDKILLNRFLSLPIFLSIMYLMFFVAINLGGIVQNIFDTTTNEIFVTSMSEFLSNLATPNWLIALLANGLGKGISTTLTFIPVIFAMYFCLSLLDLSGYMARAAFVIDKFMRILGLPGKAFIPMIVGFGCNVPAIMASRTLDSNNDRLLTILMSPFMSCSARLAIYAAFVSAFFPHNGQNIVFSLYLIGILAAVITGFLLKKTLFIQQSAPLILELPAYHMPGFKRLLSETFRRVKIFIVRAGKLILPVCVVLGALNAFTIHGNINVLDASSDSLLSIIGKCITPIFYPLGITPENWPASVGLLTGLLAKEVVIGSLSSLYSTIYTADGSFFGAMQYFFDGKVGAFAYLLFILLYIPCISTIAAIRQEANRTLMWFSIIWSLLIAYSSSVLFYQIATFYRHPLETLIYILLIAFSLTGFIKVLFYKSSSWKFKERAQTISSCHTTCLKCSNHPNTISSNIR